MQATCEYRNNSTEEGRFGTDTLAGREEYLTSDPFSSLEEGPGTSYHGPVSRLVDRLHSAIYLANEGVYFTAKNMYSPSVVVTLATITTALLAAERLTHRFV